MQELEALAAEAGVPRGPAETASFAALLAAAGEEAGGGGATLATPSAQALAERTGGTAAPEPASGAAQSTGLEGAAGAGAAYGSAGAAASPYAPGVAAGAAPYSTGAPATEGSGYSSSSAYPAGASYAGVYATGVGGLEGVSQAALQRSGAAPYAQAIDRAAVANGIEPAILFGLIEQESGFNPQARSSAGALGLTQLMPATAASLGVREPLDPWEAIEGGARYLGGLLREFHGSVQEALAAYNAGPGAVSSAGGIPPIPETEAYVADVLANARSFRGE